MDRRLKNILIKTLEGRIGRHALLCCDEDKEFVAYNADAVFNPLSCMKVFVAIVAFYWCRNKEIRLNDVVEITSNDLFYHNSYVTMEESNRVYLNYLQALYLEGKISNEYNEKRLTVEDLIVIMLEISDNTAANALLRILGGIDRFNNTLVSLGIDNVELSNYFKEPYRIGRFTARSYCTTYARLFRGDINGTEFDMKLMDILSKQRFKHLIYSEIQKADYGGEVTVISKSGKYYDANQRCGIADGGIVTYKNKRYFIAFLSEFDEYVPREYFRMIGSDVSFMSKMIFENIAL